MAKAFWEPPTTMSAPQASMGSSDAISPEIASMMLSAPCLFATSRMAFVGFVTPVEVSLWVKAILLAPEDARASSTATGSAAVPHSNPSVVTSRPYRSEISAHRWPNAPISTTRILSPGECTLAMAASMPPVPEAVRVMTSPSVPKTSLRRTVTDSRFFEN